LAAQMLSTISSEKLLPFRYVLADAL
jgi:hypothetical protein